MSIPVTKQSTDLSDEEWFSFGFCCDRCGKEWRSRKVKFGVKGFSFNEDDPQKNETLKLFWELKHRAAFEQANLEARLHFSLCPLCGKWVCDNCFCAEEISHGGICKTCEGKELKKMSRKERMRSEAKMNVNEPDEDDEVDDEDYDDYEDDEGPLLDAEVEHYG